MKKYLLLFMFLVINVNLISAEKKNHAALFLGATSGIFDYGETNFTFGVDYTRRIIVSEPNLGIGVFAEFIVAKHSETIIGVPFSVYPSKSLKLFIAPAIAFLQEVVMDPLVDPIPGKDLPTETVNKIFVRVGVAYDFHIKNFSLGPNVNADVIDGNFFLVYGLSAGISF